MYCNDDDDAADDDVDDKVSFTQETCFPSFLSFKFCFLSSPEKMMTCIIIIIIIGAVITECQVHDYQKMCYLSNSLN